MLVALADVQLLLKVLQVVLVPLAHLRSAAAAAETVTNTQQHLPLVPESVVPILFLAAAAVVAAREALEITLQRMAVLAALWQVAAWFSNPTLTPEPQVFLAVMHFQETWLAAVQVAPELNRAELLRFLDPQLFTQRVAITGPGKMAQILLGHLRMDLVARLTSPTA